MAWGSRDIDKAQAHFMPSNLKISRESHLNKSTLITKVELEEKPK
jgi:hypothetical protein